MNARWLGLALPLACSSGPSAMPESPGTGGAGGSAAPGEGALGAPCAAHGDCASLVCVGGRCTRECDAPTDCPPGNSWSCAPAPAVGRVCQCVANAAETCNGGDDDCDATVDEDAPCPALHSCVAGTCACTGGTACGSACVDTTSDPAHCGGCDAACPPSATCTAGLCDCPATLVACGSACVDTNVDPNDCGACGVACGSLQTCVQGACTCVADTCGATCVDSQNDPLHCGACDHGCLGGACVAGKCQPVALAPGIAARAVAVDASYAFFTSDAGVHRVPLSGGMPSLLFGVAMDQYAWGLAIDATSVYWATLSPHSIMTGPLGGGLASPVVPSTPVRRLFLAGTDLLWGAIANVMKISTTGGPSTAIASGQADVYAVVARGPTALWSDTTSPALTSVDIRSAPLAGGGPVTTLVVGEKFPVVLATDATHLYWVAAAFGGRVARIPLAGGAVEELVAAAGPTAAIAVDEAHVFWVDWDGGNSHELRRAPKGGGPIETLAEVSGGVFDIAVDAAAIYWADLYGSGVFRLAK